MERKFPNIDFDLSQNLLRYNHLARLDYYSLILFSSYLMKELDILDELKEIDFEMQDILLDKKVIWVIDAFLAKIRRKISEHFIFKVEILETYLQSTMRLVLERTIKFLQIAKVYLLDERQLVVKNIVFTLQGTVNTKKTLIQVLDKENFSAYRKFKLAARFFLREKIVRYYSVLTDGEKSYHLNVDIEDDFALYYWVWQINGSRAPIKNLSVCYLGKFMKIQENGFKIQHSGTVIQNIFERAVKHHNEIAVQYLWINHVSKFIERELSLKHSVTSYMAKASHINIVMYLLIFQARKEELTYLIDRDMFKNLMLLFYNNKRYIVLFPDVLKTLSENFTGQDYFYILQNIATIFRNNSNMIDFNFLHTYLREIPDDKRNMLGNYNGSWEVYHELLRAAFDELNVDMVEIVLQYCSRVKIFEFFLSIYFMDLLEIPIRKFYYEFVNAILGKHLDELQIRQVKSRFFREKSFQLCFCFMHVGIFELNTYTDWLSDSVILHSMIKFKFDFLLMNNGKGLRDILFFHRKFSIINPLSYADLILKWCSGGDYRSVKLMILLHTKEKDPHSKSTINCYGNVIDLVLQSNWEFLNELIYWKKCKDEDRIKLGRRLLTDPYLFEQILKKTDCLYYIYEFSDWLRVDLHIEEYDFTIFKAEVFNKIKIFLNTLIINWDLDGIKRLLIWCKQPLSKVRCLGLDIQYLLQNLMPNTYEARIKFNEFYNWLWR
ncbi:UNVERIFIED_CONTAM: hypothetical protein RMT77_018615 [Armadillidium vulgare]